MTETQAPYFHPCPKSSRYRDDAYLAYVRLHRCMNPQCRRPAPSQAHHVDAVDGTGIGTKPSDLWAVPLCWECHRLVEDGLLKLDKELYLREICKLLAEKYRMVKGR